MESIKTDPTDGRNWFVLRDLTRSIAKLPGYLRVQQAGLEVFTPMKWVVSGKSDKKDKKAGPYYP